MFFLFTICEGLHNKSIQEHLKIHPKRPQDTYDSYCLCEEEPCDTYEIFCSKQIKSLSEITSTIAATVYSDAKTFNLKMSEITPMSLSILMLTNDKNVKITYDSIDTLSSIDMYEDDEYSGTVISGSIYKGSTIKMVSFTGPNPSIEADSTASKFTLTIKGIFVTKNSEMSLLASSNVFRSFSSIKLNFKNPVQLTLSVTDQSGESVSLSDVEFENKIECSGTIQTAESLGSIVDNVPGTGGSGDATTKNATSSPGGLSGGAIAGIVIAVVVVVAGVVVGVIFFLRSKKKAQEVQPQ